MDLNHRQRQIRIANQRRELSRQRQARSSRPHHPPAVPYALCNGLAHAPNATNGHRGIQTSVGSILAGTRKPEPRRLPDVVDQMRSDYQIKFTDLTLKANIQAVAVTVSTDSTDPRATALAESLQATWERSLRDMCQAIGDGRVAFQKRWDFRAKSMLNCVKLDPLPVRQTEMLMDDQGQFLGIRLRGKSSLTEEKCIDIPPDQSWWLALDATATEPHGRSRYLGATHEEWTSRRELFELRMKYLRKFMLRGGVIRGPAQLFDPVSKTMIDTAKAIAMGLDALQVGGFAFFPDERNKEGNYAFEIEEPAKLGDPAAIDATLDKSDVRVLRSQGVSELAVQQTGDLGSFAMAVMHRLILNAVVGGIVSQFAESFDAYVIQKAVDLNFEAHEAPEVVITWPDLTAVPDSLMVEVAKSVLTAPQLPAGAALVNLKSVFEVAGIPIDEAFDRRLQDALRLADAARMPVQIPPSPPPQIVMWNSATPPRMVAPQIVPAGINIIDAADIPQAGGFIDY